jgi:hypothetical protein
VQESNLLNEPQLPNQALRFLIPQKYPAERFNASQLSEFMTELKSDPCAAWPREREAADRRPRCGSSH